MRKNLLICLFLLFLISCNVKMTRNMLVSGNYDQAIIKSIDGLHNNKDRKGNQDFVYILEEAFAKANERDVNAISFWTTDANPANLEKIYTTYIVLNNRQEIIKPLLPLKLLKENRNAIFPFTNYNNQIVQSKNALSDYLYQNATRLLTSNNKMDFRKAFDDLNYLNKINPNYKDVIKLMDKAYFKGIDFVMVNTQNETNMTIPTRLLNDLLDFSTYGVNDKWTVYHNIKTKGITYDYDMIIGFRDIMISPEQIKEREFVKEKEIKDGVKKVVNTNGRPVLDKEGKEIFVDNMVNVSLSIYEIRQLKTCQITAKVDFLTTKTKSLIQSFPIASQFVFENIYSTFKGDRRAADPSYTYFNNRVVPFPNTEQMIYDTGEDLKNKIKAVLNGNKFRQ